MPAKDLFNFFIQNLIRLVKHHNMEEEPVTAPLKSKLLQIGLTGGQFRNIIIFVIRILYMRIIPSKLYSISITSNQYLSSSKYCSILTNIYILTNKY